MITGSRDPEEVWIVMAMRNSGMSDSGSQRWPVAVVKAGSKSDCRDYMLAVQAGRDSLPALVFASELHLCRLGDVDDVYRSSSPMGSISLR